MEYIVEERLKPIDGYLMAINRNTEMGWYELEVGIPSTWIFRGSKTIECTTIASNDTYKLVKIAPQETADYVVIDELIEFVTIIITTNMVIMEKENEFKRQMDLEKLALEEKVKSYYNEVENLKVNSFTNFEEKNIPPPVSKKVRVSKKNNVEENGEPET